MSVVDHPTRHRRAQPSPETDLHWPRDPANRYRIYRLRKGELEVMCTAASSQGIGVALVTLAEEDEFGPNDAVGVLDTLGRSDVSGTWIVNPYATGR